MRRLKKQEKKDENFAPLLYSLRLASVALRFFAIQLRSSSRYLQGIIFDLTLTLGRP